MTADETARADFARKVALEAIRDGKAVELLYFKEKTGETTRREGIPTGVFSSGSKESVHVEHAEGGPRTYNLRNILRIRVKQD